MIEGTLIQIIDSDTVAVRIDKLNLSYVYKRSKGSTYEGIPPVSYTVINELDTISKIILKEEDPIKEKAIKTISTRAINVFINSKAFKNKYDVLPKFDTAEWVRVNLKRLII